MLGGDSDNKIKGLKSFTRRAFVMGGMQLALLGVMGTRLGYLQLAEGRRYRMLSDKNRIHTKILAPSRGEILDRYGVAMAKNAQNFRVVMTPEQVDDIAAVLEKLKGLIGIQDSEIEQVMAETKKVAKFSAIQIRDNLTWDDVSKIEVNLPDLSGLRIDVGEIRHYPMKEATAHLVGYVGAVSQEEVRDDPVFNVPDFKIGRTGIEKAYDEKLRGSAGTAQVEVNVVGREIRELDRKPSIDGETMVLSIDSDLQKIVQDRLAQEQSASAVIMDVNTGAVYACASYPSFDPNVFTRPLSPNVWEEMISNPGHPLTNKAVAGQYPPGSTFKMVTALALLEGGATNLSKYVHCPGHYDYGSGRFHCWKKGGHGSVNVIDALAQSCDVYFYKLSTEIGINKIAETARRLGLGGLHDFDLPEERAGLIPDENWKMGYMGKKWTPGETIVSSIGQGATLATPLQLAIMTSRLVNGGVEVTPWMYSHKENINQSPKSLGFKKENLEIVRKGMEAVVNGPRGTAMGSRIYEAGLEMGGKTGTAQVRRITMKQRAAGVKNEDLPWASRHHALFVGYAPYTNPRYACAVVVEHGVSGSGSAAPLARDILLEVQKRKPALSPLATGPAKVSEDGKGA